MFAVCSILFFTNTFFCLSTENSVPQKINLGDALNDMAVVQRSVKFTQSDRDDVFPFREREKNVSPLSSILFVLINSPKFPPFVQFRSPSGRSKKYRKVNGLRPEKKHSHLKVAQ